MDTKNDFERELEHLKQVLQNLPKQQTVQQFGERVEQTGKRFAQNFQNTQPQRNTNAQYTDNRYTNYRSNTQSYPKTNVTKPNQKPQHIQQNKPPVQQNQPVQYRQNHQPAVPYQPTWLQRQGRIAGKTASVLFRTFGLIGAIPTVPIAAVGTLVQYYQYGLNAAISFGTPTGGIAFLFVLMTMIGFGINKTVKRCKKYRDLFANNKMVTLDQLAAVTQRSKRFLLKDIKKMIRNGSLSEIYLDAGQTCLILDHETYKQYLQLENRRKNLESEQNASARLEDGMQKIGAQGKEYIRQIRLANDALPGQEISDKLFRLEAITLKIFEYIDKHPEKLDQVDKFMNYYMPTVTKLVNAYQEFDAQPIQGENIQGAKREIEQMLDTVCAAFENVLDGLFAENALDVSADISVMETMLRQDGLTKDEISGGLK